MLMARVTRARDLCVTLHGEECEINAYFTSLSDLSSLPHHNILYLVVGRERGEQGRLHLQAFMQLRTATRFQTIHNWGGLWSNCHLEARKGPVEAAINYCKKDGDFKEIGTCQTKPQGKRSDLIAVQQAIQEGMDWQELCETYFSECARYGKFFQTILGEKKQTTALEALKQELQNSQLRPWQQELKLKVEQEPDRRQILWYWDSKGNTGKSWMAKYLMAFSNALILESGRKMDLAYIFQNHLNPVVIFDLARTTAPDPEARSSPLDVIYSLMENLKNGYLISTKYESKRVLFNVPHVIVFANYEPDYSKMSGDRWNITRLD